MAHCSPRKPDRATNRIKALMIHRRIYPEDSTHFETPQRPDLLAKRRHRECLVGITSRRVLRGLDPHLETSRSCRTEIRVRHQRQPGALLLGASQLHIFHEHGRRNDSSLRSIGALHKCERVPAVDEVKDEWLVAGGDDVLEMCVPLLRPARTGCFGAARGRRGGKPDSNCPRRGRMVYTTSRPGTQNGNLGLRRSRVVDDAVFDEV